MTALMAWPTSILNIGRQVAKQVAAPAETRTPNLHRARIAHQECGWKVATGRRKTLMEGHYTSNMTWLPCRVVPLKKIESSTRDKLRPVRQTLASPSIL